MAQILICDVCGTRKNVNRRQYAYDRRSDGAGSSGDVYEIFDLCLEHELLALKCAINESLKKDIHHHHDFNSLIIFEIKEMMKK